MFKVPINIARSSRRTKLLKCVTCYILMKTSNGSKLLRVDRILNVHEILLNKESAKFVKIEQILLGNKRNIHYLRLY